jgi:hypothetical protein
MSAENERLEILEMIQRGTISPQDGLKLIQALEDEWEEETIPEEFSAPESSVVQPLVPGAEFDAEDLNHWKSRWVIPFWIGVGLTALGGALLYWAWSASGVGVGFFLAWIPFLIGVGTMVLGWNSKTGPWIHIRIQEAPGEKPERIAISLPIPIRFFAWIIRTFGGFIRGVDATGINEVILALENSSPGDQPLSINITDGEDGEKVKVYIG